MGPARLVVAAVLAGCYSPSASPGAPCNAEGQCPSGLECLANVCELPGGVSVDGSLRIDMAMVDGELDAAVTEDAGPDSDASIDAAIDSMPDAPPPTPIWGTPTALNIQGTDPSLDDDRLEIAFVRSVGGNDQIFHGSRPDVASPFTFSELGEVNSAAADRSPELALGGMYLTSARGGDGFDVYFASNFFGVWLTPTVAPNLSSSTLDDNDIAIAPNGLTAIVTRTDNAGERSFWLSSRAQVSAEWGTPVRMPDFEITADISGPTLTNNAATVYFHAGAVRDLYVARKTGIGNNFTVPEPVTELNTAVREAAPFVDQAEGFLIFERAGSLLEAPQL